MEKISPPSIPVDSANSNQEMKNDFTVISFLLTCVLWFFFIISNWLCISSAENGILNGNYVDITGDYYSSSVFAEFVVAKIDDLVNWARRVSILRLVFVLCWPLV